MVLLLKMLLTLAVGWVCGIVLRRLKVPNGLRIGALLGSALLGIFFGAAWVPFRTKYAAQIIAGAIIGGAIKRNDLKLLPKLIKPTAIIVVSLLILNVGGGFLIHFLSPLSWVTAFLCFIPGGISEIPIIAVDMGADAPKVAVAQLARYFLGVAAFPPMAAAADSFIESRSKTSGPENKASEVSPGGTAEENIPTENTLPAKNKGAFALFCTVAAGSAGGFLGAVSGIPGGVFLFSMIPVFILNVAFDLAFIPGLLKKITLVVSGCYIGSLMTMNDVLNLRQLALPVLIIIAGYILNCFITGAVLHKTTGLSRIEAMMSTTPAGASDLALSASEMGIKNTDIIIIQVFRSTIAISVFPQIISVLLLVLE